MMIRNGAAYRFKGATYRATLEDSELAPSTLASFQRLPIEQIDDEPVMFLDRNDGSLSGDTGEYLGDVSELTMVC